MLKRNPLANLVRGFEMRIVGADFGRVSFLTDLLEIGPSAGLTLADIAAALGERYSFAVMPQNSAKDAQSTVYRFEQGRMPGPGAAPITYFEIHQFGLVAQAIDTKIAQEFLGDLIEFGTEVFGLRKSEARDFDSVYASAVVVQFGEDFNGLLRRFNTLQGFLQPHLARLYGVHQSPALSRLALRPDPESMKPRMSNLLTEFSLERRSFEPFERNRFYSVAPLPSELHEQYLSHLETLARG